MLTHDQKEAIKALEDFRKGDSPELCLLGSAGTGKSFLLAHWLHNYYPSSRVALIAPTHKAKGVLLNFANQNGLQADVFTSSSFLNLKPMVSKSGERLFCLQRYKKDTRQDLRKEAVDYLTFALYKEALTPKLVCVDECSMVTDYHVKLLRYVARELRFKILWLGDKYQLPPIQNRKVNASLPIRDATPSIELKEVVRNKGEILALCNNTRDNIEEGKIEAPSYDSLKLRGNLVRKAVSDFEAGKDCQVIAWRNRTVDNYNDEIREELLGELAEEELVQGERVVFNSGYNRQLVTGYDWKTKVGNCIEEASAYSSERGLIKQVDKARDFVPFLRDRVKSFVEKDLNITTEQFTWLITDIQKDDGTNIFVTSVSMDDIHLWKNLLKEVRYKVRDLPGNDKKREWSLYYELADSHANISYGYAITADKSQGSTYSTVYVDGKDILRKRDLDAIKRFYVAVSRAKEELYIK